MTTKETDKIIEDKLAEKIKEIGKWEERIREYEEELKIIQKDERMRDSIIVGTVGITIALQKCDSQMERCKEWINFINEIKRFEEVKA
jgi:hypothetical protein